MSLFTCEHRDVRQGRIKYPGSGVVWLGVVATGPPAPEAILSVRLTVEPEVTEAEIVTRLNSTLPDDVRVFAVLPSPAPASEQWGWCVWVVGRGPGDSLS